MQNQSPIFLITTTFLAHELPSAQVFLLFRGFIATPAKHICPCEVNLWPSASVRRRHIGLTVERLYTDRGGTYLSPPPFFFFLIFLLASGEGRKVRGGKHTDIVWHNLYLEDLLHSKLVFPPIFPSFFLISYKVYAQTKHHLHVLVVPVLEIWRCIHFYQYVLRNRKMEFDI